VSAQCYKINLRRRTLLTTLQYRSTSVPIYALHLDADEHKVLAANFLIGRKIQFCLPAPVTDIPVGVTPLELQQDLESLIGYYLALITL